MISDWRLVRIYALVSPKTPHKNMGSYTDEIVSKVRRFFEHMKQTNHTKIQEYISLIGQGKEIVSLIVIGEAFHPLRRDLGEQLAKLKKNKKVEEEDLTLMIKKMRAEDVGPISGTMQEMIRITTEMPVEWTERTFLYLMFFIDVWSQVFKPNTK